MDGLKKLAGVYLVGVAVVVAVYFIINNFLAGSFDVLRVWYVMDVLMLIGLALALIFNYASMREEGGRGETVTRRYLEVNTAFFVTAGVTILFLQLVVPAGPGAGHGLGTEQLKRQPPGLGNLGGGGHAAAAGLGGNRLPPLAGVLGGLTTVLSLD